VPAQVRFLKPLLIFTRLDRKGNYDIRDRLKDANLLEEINEYQQKWRNHLKGIERDRLSQLELCNQPKGR